MKRGSAKDYREIRDIVESEAMNFSNNVSTISYHQSIHFCDQLSPRVIKQWEKHNMDEFNNPRCPSEITRLDRSYIIYKQ